MAPAACSIARISTLSAFSPPSPGAFTAYSSFVPITISGRPSPVRSPTAGVSTIAPCMSESPACVVEGHLMRGGVDLRHLRAVDHERREARRGGAVGAPRVHVPVHRGGHDLEPRVALDVGEHRRAEEAALGAVALAPARLVELAQRPARPVEASSRSSSGACRPRPTRRHGPRSRPPPPRVRRRGRGRPPRATRGTPLGSRRPAPRRSGRPRRPCGAAGGRRAPASPAPRRRRGGRRARCRPMSPRSARCGCRRRGPRRPARPRRRSAASAGSPAAGPSRGAGTGCGGPRRAARRSPPAAAA